MYKINYFENNVHCHHSFLIFPLIYHFFFKLDFLSKSWYNFVPRLAGRVCLLFMQIDGKCSKFHNKAINNGKDVKQVEGNFERWEYNL